VIGAKLAQEKSMLPRAHPRRGQALAEMAIILPILLLLVFGIIEMSNAWRSFQVVTNAAREGARVGVIATSTLPEVTSRIDQHLESGGLDPSARTLTVTCVISGAPELGLCQNTGQEFRVQVSYPFAFQVLGRFSGLVPITISSTSTMRRE
jgi:Flp pilus assembly protein TadG